MLDDAKDAYLQAMAAPEEEQMTTGLEVNKTLKSAAKQLAGVVKKAKDAGKSSARAEEGLAQLQAWGDEILRTCLKV